MRPCRSGRNLRRQGTDKTIARTRDVNWLNRPPRNSNDAIAIQSYCASPAKGDTNQTSELNYIRGELALRRLKFWKNEPFEPSPLRSGVWDMYKHVAEQSGLFDKSWYLRQYPEAVKPGLDPFEHYTNEGWKNGCSPGPLFDSPWYLDYYRDVAAAGLEPLGHYIFYGKAEGRKTNGASFALGKLVDSELHIPTTLSVSHLTPKHVLVIGSCFAYSVAYLVKETIPECECDYLLYNFVGQLPEPPPRAVSDYDFIVIMLPLRSVMPEYGYMRLPYGDMAAFSSFFESSVGRLEQLLNGALAYTRAHQKAAFVLNFLAPHGNYMGRLLPRRDLRNPSYFCSQLNIELEKMLEGQKSAHLIDLDALACSLGKRWINDDTLWVSSHGTFIDDWDPPQDARRLEQTTPIMQQFHFLTPPDFIGYIWREIVASYRIVRQADAIKLVVTDLDDTLWRGVAMDHEAVNTAIAIEGWPLGYIEALLIVKRRGLLLGVISKNDRANIEKLWPEICNGAIEIRAPRKIRPSTRRANQIQNS